MRITKKTLRVIKAALSRRLKEVCRMDDERLRAEAKRMFPNLIVHVGEDCCPNCGAEKVLVELPSGRTRSWNCRCNPAERAAAEVDRRPQEMIRQIMEWAIEAAIPSHWVDDVKQGHKEQEERV